MQAQVLVIGAGPVGMTAALALARQGVRVRIVDSNARRTDKSKALVVWPRTLELLDVQGCAQPFVDAGLAVHDARARADGEELLHVSFESARSPWRFALMLPQSETERLLEEQLARLGVLVERRTTLVSFDDTGDGVAATLRHGGEGDDAPASDDTVRADWLVACDGAHSTVRHGLAATDFEGDTLPSNWVLADVEVDGAALAQEVAIHFSRHGLLVVLPIGGRRFRVIAETGADTPEAPPEPTLAEVQALVDARGPAGLRLHQPHWISRFRINERKVRDYRVGRVFLAGDAAHVHSPAGGQGMNTGMQDAINLAWKLAMVCRGDAHEDLLASYSPERSAIGDQVLRNAGLLTRVALLDNPVLQRLRAIAANVVDHLPAAKQRFVDQMTEIDLHYADSPLTQRPHGASRHPAGGERAPDLALAGTPARRLHEVLGTGRFAVLSVDAPEVRLPDSLGRIAVAVAAAGSPDYAGGHVYLVRPDAYVALSVAGDDPAPLIAALERIASPRPAAAPPTGAARAP